MPERVEVRLGPGDEELRRTAHAIHQASFAAHYGFAPQEFEPWHEAFEASSTHDWAQLQVLLVDGEPAGLLVGNDQFVGDEDCGHVRIVGVLVLANFGSGRDLRIDGVPVGQLLGRSGVERQRPPAGSCIATLTVGALSSPSTLSTNSDSPLEGTFAGVISA